MIKLIILLLFCVNNFVLSQQYTITQRTPWEWAEERIFQQTMIGNIISTVKWLKKNYDQSIEFCEKATKYYNKIEKLQSNPYGALTDEDIRKFISRYERGKELISTVDKMVATYGEAKKTVEGIVEQYEKTKKLFSGKIESVKENIEQNINYLSKNWNFIEGIVEDLKTQTSDTISKLEKMKEIKNMSNNEEKKVEVERIKTSVDLLQLQAQQQTNLLLVKLLEFQISQKEKQIFQNKQIIDRQYQFYTAIKNRLSKNLEIRKR